MGVHTVSLILWFGCGGVDRDVDDIANDDVAAAAWLSRFGLV